MFCRSLELRSTGWLALVLGIVVASPVSAQTPTNTWTGTATDNWSNGANWSNGTAPAQGATTVLQFNANGATTYTAFNDIADPFSLNGLLFNSSSSNPITVDGNVGGSGSGALTFQATGSFINQNSSGAVVINNALNVTNGSTSGNVTIGGAGSGTITLNGIIGGAGGIKQSNIGGATVVITNNAGANGFGTVGIYGGYLMSAPGGTALVTATSGTPLGISGINFIEGTLNFSPSGSGANIAL